MISTAVLNCAEENEPIAHHVASMRLQTLDIFTARIERGIAECDMRPDVDPRSLARFLGAIVQGMSVQARDGATTDELLALIAHALSEVRKYQLPKTAGL